MERWTKDRFLSQANGKSKTRLFDEEDYDDFRRALRRAKSALKRGKPCYAEGNAGGVANAYGYVTTTARWGIYVLGDQVHVIVDRVPVSGRSVKRAFENGERGYLKAYRETQLVTQ